MSGTVGEQEIRIDRIVIRDADMSAADLRAAIGGELRRHGVQHADTIADTVAASVVDELAAHRRPTIGGAGR